MRVITDTEVTRESSSHRSSPTSRVASGRRQALIDVGLLVIAVVLACRSEFVAATIAFALAIAHHGDGSASERTLVRSDRSHKEPSC